ncbi:hypothetical protein SBA4_2930006 [Candidatus Sulfopaludibacter sp. SbA4]|nr:hypothetical protein SBA4_2930006 [Candidatus Sulfopaludibacter sp. SbA4]
MTRVTLPRRRRQLQPPLSMRRQIRDIYPRHQCGGGTVGKNRSIILVLLLTPEAHYDEEN